MRGARTGTSRRVAAPLAALVALLAALARLPVAGRRRRRAHAPRRRHRQRQPQRAGGAGRALLDPASGWRSARPLDLVVDGPATPSSARRPAAAGAGASFAPRRRPRTSPPYSVNGRIFIRRGNADAASARGPRSTARPGSWSSPPATASTAAPKTAAAQRLVRLPRVRPRLQRRRRPVRRLRRPPQQDLRAQAVDQARQPRLRPRRLPRPPQRRRRQPRRRGRRRRHDRHSTCAAHQQFFRPSAIPGETERMQGCQLALRRRRHAHLPASPARRRWRSAATGRRAPAAAAG